MKIDIFLKEKGVSGASLGREVGISRVTASRIIRGLRKPSTDELMNRISKFTNGAVTANDFFDLNPEAIIGNHTTITQQNHVKSRGKHAGK